MYVYLIIYGVYGISVVFYKYRYKMVFCNYLLLLEKDLVICGLNWKDFEDFCCVVFRDCGKDVVFYFKMCKVVDLRIVNEF